MKRCQKFLVLLCLVYVLYNTFATSIVEAATLKLNKTNLTLVENKSYTLKMTGNSEKITWSSNDKTIATVKAGKVIAVKPGSTTVTAKVGKSSYKCKVTVVPKFIKSDYETSLRQSLVGRYIDVAVNKKTQSFLLDDEDVLDFHIESAFMNSDCNEVGVVATMEVDRTVSKVNLEYTCKYTLKSNKWKLSSVTTKSSLSDIEISGIWKGNYILGIGEVALELNITNVTEDGYANAEFYFYAPPTNPKIPSGRYMMKGGIDFETGKLTFVGVEWIDNSSGWGMLDIDGQIDVANKCISGNNQMKVYPVAQ